MEIRFDPTWRRDDARDPRFSSLSLGQNFACAASTFISKGWAGVSSISANNCDGFPGASQRENVSSGKRNVDGACQRVIGNCAGLFGPLGLIASYFTESNGRPHSCPAPLIYWPH